MQNFDDLIPSTNEDLFLEPGITEIIEEFDWDNALQTDILNNQIINLSNQILIQAIERNASTIHIEPLEDSLRIRFRIDDVLQQPFKILPGKIISLIIDCFKIMADLDQLLQNFPQIGIIQRIYRGRKVEFLIDTLPNRYGEKIVLRRYYRNHVDLDLDKLITDRQSLHLIREMIRRPFGLILVTCPCGGGMTTTLYSLLAELNKPDKNLCDVHYHFEYSLPGITQVRVDREKDMSFDKITQSFMRQDPDVILVNETPDRYTAKTVIEAAERCLVLAGLHGSDVPGAIARLDEMGIEPFMVSHVLIGAIAQCLLRRVCHECAIPYTPTTAELAHFGLSPPIPEKTIYKANTRKERLANKSLENLCSNCHGKGYKGFIGVYEVMPITSTIKTLIKERVTPDMIYLVAEAEGMKSLFDYSLDLVWQKYTTLEEVNWLIQNVGSFARRLIVSPNTILQDLERQLENISYQIKQVKQQINKRFPNDS